MTTKEAEGDEPKKCKVEHTVVSEDPCFKMPAASFMKQFEITMTAKMCKCDNGDPAKNEKCPANNEQLCESCNLAFSLSSDKKTCESCVAGKFGESAGVCTDCPNGQYEETAGQLGCKRCQAGQSFTSSTTPCESCVAGKFGESAGVCTDCPKDQFQDAKGQEQCKSCTGDQVFTSSTTPCIDAGAGPLTGIPVSDAISEGGAYAYDIKMAAAAPAGATTTIQITSTNTLCTVSPSTLSFDASDGTTTAKTISVQTTDDGSFTTQDTAAYSCDIQHEVAITEGGASLVGISTMSLVARSKGCGLGEYFGTFDRGDDGTSCVCSPSYFIPPNHECTKCPTKESDCNSIGLLTPIVKSNFWRSDPTSPNLTTTPFYSCPFPNTCLGGNSSIGRCAIGHDDASPVCAICSLEYVLQGEKCLPCPGYTDDAAATAPLSAAVSVVLIYVLIVMYYLSRPALSKEIRSKVRRRLTLASSSRLSASAGNDDTLDRMSFATIMKTGNNEDDELHLTPTETNMIYSEIDEDGAGSITMAELHAYIRNEQDRNESKKSKSKKAKDKSDETKEEKMRLLLLTSLTNAPPTPLQRSSLRRVFFIKYSPPLSTPQIIES